jgi:addiction module HigA family antidote
MYNPAHPGEILKELYLEPLGLSVTETAKGLGIARKSLSEIINGHYGISVEMSMRLAKAFDTSPESWLNMQQQYDLWKNRDFNSNITIKSFIAHSSNYNEQRV